VPSNLAHMDVLVPTHPITLDEYLALELLDEWGSPLPTELAGGMVIVSPPAGGPHQVGVAELIAMFVAACPAGYRVLPGGGWIVDDSPLATFRVPDIMVVSDQQARQTWMDAPPLLAVEVVSRRSSVERDLVAKRREYAEAGCAHYWALFPDTPELIRFRLDDGGAYVEAGRTTGRRRVRVTEPFAVTIDLARVTV
jgi:Uma2 family endonuclease